jgi:predicted AAA+ superfamily ATPase
MSLFESGLSSGTASIGSLWSGEQPPGTLEAPGLDAVAEAACRGGWPALAGIPLDLCLDLNRSYLRTIASADIVTVDGIRRDPRKVEALLRALGRNTGTYVSNRVLQTDSTAFGERIDPTTIASYLDALIRLWVLAEQPAWGGHLRSSAPARKASKRHLVDPSLAVAAMDADPDSLMGDREAFGQVFETLVFRDLSVYAQASGLELRSFHDAKNREIDAVLVKGARWAGIEIKLSASEANIDATAANLLAITKTTRTTPTFLAIITSTGPSYTRPDGVHVIPVTHLGA